MVQEQIAEIERERDTARTPCEATERKRHLLLQLKSIGPAISALISVKSITANLPTGGRWEAFWASPQAPTAAARRSAARGSREREVATCGLL